MSPAKKASGKAVRKPRTAAKPRGPVVHPVPVFREALDGARPTLDDFARATDIPMGTLLSYYSGTRRAPEPVRRALAVYLRQLARHLVDLADRLTAPLDPPETPA